MPVRWKSPIYTLATASGKSVQIDVTSSVSAALPPSQVLTSSVIPLFKLRDVSRVVDFGAGALRHTLPLLEAGFEVCAVEFEAAYQRPVCSRALEEAKKYANFSSLLWPHDFLADRRRFDAALLCYVLQTMPVPAERALVLKALKKRLVADSYLLYMSRFNQLPAGIKKDQRVSDGYFMWPKRTQHSFYREFTTAETHLLFESHGLRRIRSLSQRGTDQMFLYAKGDGSWI